MSIYFFSRHESSNGMIQDVGEITKQYKGTISALKAEGNIISFIETFNETISEEKQLLLYEGDLIIIVAPLTLQIEWLNATRGLGIKLLIPQMLRKFNAQGEAQFIYSSLLEIKSIQIISEKYEGHCKNKE